MDTFRKILCMVLPNGVRLRRRLSGGEIVTGLNRPGYGGRGVFCFGESIEPELESLSLFIQSGQTFVDVGANTGVYAMKAANIVGPSGQVIALEPNPEMFASLYRNARINGFENVRARLIGASERLGVCQFYSNFNKPNSYSMQAHDDRASSTVILTIDLDTLLSVEGVSSVDCVKIDVEGGESSVLAGLERTIASFRPIVIAERTKAKVVCPAADYVTLARGGSPNLVFCPAERIDGLIEGGWDWILDD